MSKIKKIGGDVPTNAAKELIEMGCPYVASVEIQGASDLIFHRWNCEVVDERANAKRGSKTKKTDNVESYVYRNDKNEICIPGEYLRMSLINAARFKQDPRSTRKSAMDLYKAGVVTLTSLSSLGKGQWDYEDKRKVMIQRSGINRIRPAMKAGWKAKFDILVVLPEYISPMDLNDALQTAGRLIGVGDMRPTYGRFVVTKFDAKAEAMEKCA